MASSPLLHSLPHPPVADFDFSFDPSLSNLFPNPPPLPSSADLFSAAETTDLLGFLDNFNSFGWDGYENAEPTFADHISSPLSPRAPYSNPHLNTVPEPSTSNRPRRNTRGSSSRIAPRDPQPPIDPQHDFSSSRGVSQPRSITSDSSATPPALPDNPSAARSKPLLSTPQKRLNHIMSEQKRRNAIRDGYAQLIALLAPAGSAPGIGMPTRGRPKGSGSRGRGQTKGKSGVLFRAVEYCRFLEEGRDALRDEVVRVEAAAGTSRQQP